MSGPAALTLASAPPVPGKPRPYDDELDVEGGAILYRYRAGRIDQPDNRALRAAAVKRVPLVYFHGIAPGQYLVVAPVFIAMDDPAERAVLLEVGLPVADMQPGGPVSSEPVRAYALREVRMRLHQQRFRLEVLRAYRTRCAICSLRERQLVQAAHIIGNSASQGIAAVVNGLALCAIHHLAFDRNLSESTATASSTSAAGCGPKATGRCSAKASRASTAGASCARAIRLSTRTRTGWPLGSPSSSFEPPDPRTYRRGPNSRVVRGGPLRGNARA